MVIKSAKVFEVVIIWTQERVQNASKMRRRPYMQNGGITSSSNERLDVFLKVGVLFLDLMQVPELDNYGVPASAVIEWLCPKDSSRTLPLCQGMHQYALGLREQAAEQIIQFSGYQVLKLGIHLLAFKALPIDFQVEYHLLRSRHLLPDYIQCQIDVNLL